MVNFFVWAQVSSNHFLNFGPMFVTTETNDDIAELIFSLKELNDGVNESIIKRYEDTQNQK